MEWIGMLVTGLMLVLVAAPALLLLVTFFVLIPLAHLAPRQPVLSRASFDCSFSKRHASATFLTAPGTERAADVLDCSVFPDGRVRCQKPCLGLAAVSWRPSPMVPPFSLIADGVTLREVAPVNGH
jgi:hypothetical protein